MCGRRPPGKNFLTIRVRSGAVVPARPARVRSRIRSRSNCAKRAEEVKNQPAAGRGGVDRFGEAAEAPMSSKRLAKAW
jgi:hypothetical protein